MSMLKIISRVTGCIILFSMMACTETSRRAEQNLELLRMKAMALDSVINIESYKLKVLDSVIAEELRKAGKLDSIVNRESDRIDSLVNKVYQKIERQSK